ncbi:MAG TPA: Ig-like domain-containing protein [Chitinophagaceae bacterium]|nr:Ig-like domain-containing protein [Chitinophagaceae bacterium]HQX73824.1 Ig-like domain-containing protein [Chitinophagaceae bacterium]HQZ75259.1 Ig-like domain-containing protein [Chitinophagaceae bacterium]
MKTKILISYTALISILLISTISGPGCANIIPPQGGPRDTIPPVLLKSNPGDSSVNFSGNKITFFFDEFVEVQNAQENLLVSPLPKITPFVDSKLKEVTVKLKDTLEPNTTYTLDFGNAIKDYTEGNVFKNFTYTFSTGKHIDSFELRGNVVLAETGKTDSTLIAILHTNPDDSAVVKDKPKYIARLDGKGNFYFKNLPEKTFYLYALKDEGGTRRYFGEKQLFAFADKPVSLQQKNEPVTLYAFAARQETQSTTTMLPSISPGIRNKPGAATADKRLKYQTTLQNNQQDLLSQFEMIFEQPLKNLDSSGIRLYTDTTYQPATDYKFVKDSTNKKLTLIYEWKENTLYHLIMDKDLAEDSAGKKLLKTDTLSFNTKKKADYGALKIRFRNLDITRNPVLLFILNQNIYKSFPMTGPDFTTSLFLPGEYELRMLYDENKNGVWDPGQFLGKRKQPELVKPIERKITVKPNWQNEFDIAL